MLWARLLAYVTGTVNQEQYWVPLTGSWRRRKSCRRSLLRVPMRILLHPIPEA